MTDLSVIESNIVSMLEGSTILKKVYDHEPKTITQLPAATIFFDGFDQEQETSRRYSAGWRWIVRLYVPLRDAEKAQIELKNTIFDSLNRFRQNPRLGDSCLYHTITRGEVFVNIDQNNPQMMGELMLTAFTNEQY